MIKIGIVGTGWMASDRGRVISEIGRASVVGVCSRSLANTKAIAEAVGAKGYDDFGAMLTDVDAVVVCLPNSLHFEYAMGALKAGKAVLVEYPLAVSMDEALSLKQAAEDNDCVLMVGNTMKHEAMFGYLDMHKPRLGEIISASSRVALYSEDIAGAWYLKPGLAGPTLAFLNYHHIEYYRHFLGDAEWVLGSDQSIAGGECKSFAGGVVTMGHGRGRTSSIQWYIGDAGSGGCARGLWLNGTKGSVTVVSTKADKSKVIWDGGGDEMVEYIDDEWGAAGSCEDFASAIEGKLDWKERLESDLLTLRTGLAAQESSDQSKMVYL